MTEEDKARVDRLMVEHLGIDAEKVTPSASVEDDLGGDSLDRVELVMALEEEFGVEITDDETERLSLVEDYYAVVDRAREARRAA